MTERQSTMPINVSEEERKNRVHEKFEYLKKKYGLSDTSDMEDANEEFLASVNKGIDEGVRQRARVFREEHLSPDPSVEALKMAEVDRGIHNLVEKAREEDKKRELPPGLPVYMPQRKVEDRPDTRKGWQQKLKSLIENAGQGAGHVAERVVLNMSEQVARLSEYMKNRSKEINANASKMGWLEKNFRSWGELYDKKLGWKGKLAVGLGLGVGAGVSSVFAFPTALTLAVGGIVTQRVLGMASTFNSFEKQSLDVASGGLFAKKEKAMGKAVAQAALMTSAMLLLVEGVKEGAEYAKEHQWVENVHEWLKQYYPLASAEQSSVSSTEPAVLTQEASPLVAEGVKSNPEPTVAPPTGETFPTIEHSTSAKLPADDTHVTLEHSSTPKTYEWENSPIRETIVDTPNIEPAPPFDNPDTLTTNGETNGLAPEHSPISSESISNQFGLHISPAEAHVYAGAEEGRLYVYGGDAEMQKKIVSAYLAKNPHTVVFGADHAGNCIPWHMVQGETVPGPVMRSGGVLGLFSSAVRAPGPEMFKTIIT